MAHFSCLSLYVSPFGFCWFRNHQFTSLLGTFFARLSTWKNHGWEHLPCMSLRWACIFFLIKFCRIVKNALPVQQDAFPSGSERASKSSSIIKIVLWLLPECFFVLLHLHVCLLALWSTSGFFSVPLAIHINLQSANVKYSFHNCCIISDSHEFIKPT